MAETTPAMDPDSRLRHEEQLAHLARAVEDLSEVVALQAREIDRLARHVGLLMERESERLAADGAVQIADERPPHW